MNEGNEMWREHCKNCQSKTAEAIMVELLYVVYKTARNREATPVDMLNLMFGSNAPELAMRYAKECGLEKPGMFENIKNNENK